LAPNRRGANRIAFSHVISPSIACRFISSPTPQRTGDSQPLSISFGNRQRRNGFGRVTGSSLASLLSTVPIGECPVFLRRLGNWCAVWSSSTTTSECSSLKGDRSGPGHRISWRRDE
jgi:hypothetical protein